MLLKMGGAYCCSCAFLLPFYGIIIDHGLQYHKITEDYALAFISGEVLGILFGGIFVSFFGRKLTLIISNFTCLVFLFVSYFAFYGEEILYTPTLVGILLQFIAMGFIFYTAEICTATFRGFFMGFSFTVSHWGNYFILNAFVSVLGQHFLVCGTLAIFSSILSLIVPETPYYLALKGKLERAEDTFTWIRAGNADAVEYDLMLDKVERRMGLKEIVSSTFVVCMIMCILIEICNVSGCELLQEMYYHLNSLKDYAVDNTKYSKIYFKTIWLYQVIPSLVGSLIFLCAILVIPRKIIYGMGFVLTLLLLVPLVLASPASDMIFTLTPICFLIAAAGRTPLTMILPVEILPTQMRVVGLMAFFVFDRMIQIFLYYTSRAPKLAYIFKRVGRNWIVFTYSVSLIGIPFLLIFMPETMGRSIFELEEVTISIADILPFHGTGLQDTEESIPE